MDNIIVLYPDELDALRENGLLSEITPYYEDTYILSPKALEFIEEYLARN